MRSRSPCWLKCGSVSMATVWGGGKKNDISWRLKHYMLECGCEFGFLCVWASLPLLNIMSGCCRCVCIYIYAVCTVYILALAFFKHLRGIFTSDLSLLMRWWSSIFLSVNTMKMCQEECFEAGNTTTAWILQSPWVYTSIFNTSSICFQTASLRCCRASERWIHCFLFFTLVSFITSVKSHSSVFKFSLFYYVLFEKSASGWLCDCSWHQLMSCGAFMRCGDVEIIGPSKSYNGIMP